MEKSLFYLKVTMALPNMFVFDFERE